ncbi:MAG: IPT/TIG domain-containing protein [Vulcanimicrobiaceae bacterium]
MDNHNDLFVADTHGDEIDEFHWTCYPHRDCAWVETGSVATEKPAEDVAVDAHGTVYVSESTNEAIQVFHAPLRAGSHAAYTLTFPDTDTPNGVAVDASGNLYVAETERILEYDAPVGPASMPMVLMTNHTGASGNSPDGPYARGFAPSIAAFGDVIFIGMNPQPQDPGEIQALMPPYTHPIARLMLPAGGSDVQYLALDAAGILYVATQYGSGTGKGGVYAFHAPFVGTLSPFAFVSTDDEGATGVAVEGGAHSLALATQSPQPQAMSYGGFSPPPTPSPQPRIMMKSPYGNMNTALELATPMPQSVHATMKISPLQIPRVGSTVLFTNPNNGQHIPSNSLSSYATIEIAFTQPISPDSILAPGKFTLTGPSGPIPGTVTLGRLPGGMLTGGIESTPTPNALAQFTPNMPLPLHTYMQYTANVCCVISAGSSLMELPHSWAFTTGEVPMPTIVDISPASGSISGGTSVDIRGNGTSFSSNMRVLFGGNPAANVTFISPTEMTAISPNAYKPGPVDVRVALPGSSSGISAKTLPDQFLYISNWPPPPTNLSADTDFLSIGWNQVSWPQTSNPNDSSSNPGAKNACSSPTSYEMQVSLTPTFGSLGTQDTKIPDHGPNVTWPDCQNGTASSFETIAPNDMPATSQPRQPLYWRVASRFYGEQGPWSQVSSFVPIWGGNGTPAQAPQPTATQAPQPTATPTPTPVFTSIILRMYTSPMLGSKFSFSVFGEWQSDLSGNIIASGSGKTCFEKYPQGTPLPGASVVQLLQACKVSFTSKSFTLGLAPILETKLAEGIWNIEFVLENTCGPVISYYLPGIRIVSEPEHFPINTLTVDQPLDLAEYYRYDGTGMGFNPWSPVRPSPGPCP